jgi:putative lipase involved disintegration of autophagic bodies
MRDLSANVLAGAVTDGDQQIFVVFCPEKLAIVVISGIITTNLGKSATPIKTAGREKTDTSLQNMPFSQTGEGYFFVWCFFCDCMFNIYLTSSYVCYKPL